MAEKMTAFERLNQSSTGMTATEAEKNYNRKKPKETDFFEMIDLSDGELHNVRICSRIFATCKHWIDIIKKDGKQGSVMKVSPSFDIESGKHDSEIIDPYLENRDLLSMKSQIHYWCNVIVRDLQDMKPEKQQPWTKEETETGVKTKGSKSWTPIRVLRIPSTVIKQIALLDRQNVYRNKEGTPKTFPIGHPRFGRDIMVSYNSREAPTNMWQIFPSQEKGGPLTDEEKGYLQWDIQNVLKKVAQESIETEEEAKAEVQKLIKRTPKKDPGPGAPEDDFSETVDDGYGENQTEGETQQEYEIDDETIDASVNQQDGPPNGGGDIDPNNPDDMPF